MLDVTSSAVTDIGVKRRRLSLKQSFIISVAGDTFRVVDTGDGRVARRALRFEIGVRR